MDMTEIAADPGHTEVAKVAMNHTATVIDGMARLTGVIDPVRAEIMSEIAGWVRWMADTLGEEE